MRHRVLQGRRDELLPGGLSAVTRTLLLSAKAEQRVSLFWIGYIFAVPTSVGARLRRCASRASRLVHRHIGGCVIGRCVSTIHSPLSLTDIFAHHLTFVLQHRHPLHLPSNGRTCVQGRHDETSHVVRAISHLHVPSYASHYWYQ